MRPTIVLLAVAVLVAQAALEGAPRVIAEREGGMGLGSALIVPSIVGIAAIPVGAVIAGLVVGRASAPVGALAGAVASYAGFAAIGLAPMGALGWLIVAFAMLGAGFGMLSTAAFATAAGLPATARAGAIAVLVGAVVLARPAGAALLQIGAPMLALAGVVVVVAAVAAARSTADGPRRTQGAGTSVGRGLLGAALLGAGALLALAGADPSGLSATQIGGFVGVTGIGSLDVVRLVLLVVAVASVIAGASVASATVGLPLGVGRSAVAIASAAFAASAVVASVSAAARAGGLPADVAAWTGPSTVAGGLVGLAAWWWRARQHPYDRQAAAVGGLALLVASIGMLATALFGPSVPAAAVGAFVVGAGLATVVATHRLALASVHAAAVGLAAAAGVVAGSLGPPLGTMVGTTAGSVGSPTTQSVGAIAAVLVALAGLAATLRDGPRRSERLEAPSG